MELKIVNKNVIILVILILQSVIASSQSNYDFFGAIKLNGNDKSIVTYRLVFQENNGKIKGYSVTDLDGSHETKNSIEGTYNKKLKIFEFTEKDILYTKSKFEESSFCFINFSGKVKLVQNTSKVQGNFKGLYKNKTKCIDGTLSLIGSDKIYNLAEKINKKIQKSTKIVSKIKQQNNPLKLLDSLKINKLNANENLNVYWESKIFKMEIFDAGKEDGDVINVYQNNKLIVSNFKLLNSKKIINIVLESNKNEFKIEAINEGQIAPNTAKIVLKDDERTFDLMSNLQKNEQATITIHKKGTK